MKKITCEMCGNNDLIKENGVFVCQYCGTKYSLEEARKLLVSGVVEIDRSKDTENILKNADSTYHDGNYEEAFNLYSKVLNNNPDNPRAIIYRALSSAWQSSVKDCRIVELDHAVERAFSIAHENYGDTREFFDFCTDANASASSVINAIAKMYIDYSQKLGSTTLQILNEAEAEIEKGTKNCCVVAGNLIWCSLNDVSDFSATSDDFWSVLDTLANNRAIYKKNALKVCVFKKYVNSEYLNDIKDIEDMKNMISIKQKPEEERKAKLYWEKHADEKSSLMDEKSTLEAKIASVEGISGASRKEKLEKELTELYEKKSELGLFKTKEKKVLDEQILGIHKEISQIDSTLRSDEYNKEITALKEKYDEVCNKLNRPWIN